MITRRLVQDESVVGRRKTKRWKILTRIALILPFAAFLYSPSAASAGPLGSADGFAVLSASTVANTGSTIITGDLGLSPGSSITGLSSVVLTGTVHTDAAAQQARFDATTTYLAFALLPSARNLTGQDLGGLTLTPGVYKFDSEAQLTGTLNLNGLGDPNAIFVFQIGGTLTTASGSAVNVIGGENNRVFWDVGSSATLGTGTNFAGSILALASITMDTGATNPCGRAMALMGAVTLDTNTISTCRAFAGVSGPGGVQDVPEPGTISLSCVGLLALSLHAWQSRKRLA